jgi:hypothetical protein
MRYSSTIEAALGGRQNTRSDDALSYPIEIRCFTSGNA